MRHGHPFGRHGGHGFLGRGPFGFHGHPGFERGGRGFGRGGPDGEGGRGRRFFDHGDLRLVVLKLIADKPRHGYELIKALEEASGGAYSPSPGVIYPTLTLLEDLGYTVASDAGGGRKLFTVTPEGEAHLAENAAPVEAIFARMEQTAARSNAFHPAVLRARENLRTALKLKISAGPLSEAQIAAVAKALDDAAVAVEQA
jgi:DNA-binding PadR family transcriptional regulator